MHGCLNIIVDWINNDFNLKPHKLAEIIYHICNIIVTSVSSGGSILNHYPNKRKPCGMVSNLLEC